MRPLGVDRFEELAPRVLRAGQDAMTSLNVDTRRALKLVEQLRRHAEGIAKLYLELYLETVWKPFAEAGQPDDQWPAVQAALERLRGIAEEALLGMFDLVMAERIDENFGREFTKLSANRALSEAIRMSHMQARSSPAPIAGPFTAAMIGTSSFSNASGIRWIPNL